MNWLRNISLKFKLTILLVTLTGAMLTTFGAIAIRDFEKDKIAYVLDSGLAHSRNTAAQIRSEVGFIVEKVRFLMRGYDPSSHNFHPYMASIFPGETRLDAALSFSVEQTTKTVNLERALRKKDLTEDELRATEAAVSRMASSVLDHDVALSRPGGESKWILALKFELPSGPIVLAALVNSGNFLGVFENSQIQDTYLVTKSNEIVMSPENRTYDFSDSALKKSLDEGVRKLKSAEGIYQYRDTHDDLLNAVATVGLGDLRVVSIVPKSAALEAVHLMIVKSALFLAFLFCVTVFLSVLSSTTLTSSLKKLLSATAEITKGNFAVSVDIAGGDEVGALSAGFNTMAGEIRRLMQETAEKARMEGELKTAQLVQSTLFPKSHSTESDLEIKGFYQPASECSGDWWYYKRINNRTMFCIGDATGHGVPAALLTAAARSAASALETFPELPLHEMMAVFNRAIYNTAQGQVMMTLFLGLYDHETGIVSYCNASHEPPYFLRNKEELKRKDLIILNETVGRRLGENLDSRYESSQIQMSSGDKIVLYTDGVTELKNKNGDMWGERAFVKCLIHCNNEKKSLSSTMDKIAEEISTFRQEHPLQDDVTYFMVAKAA